MLKVLLASTTAAIALSSVGSVASAQTFNFSTTPQSNQALAAQFGELDAFYGNLDAFYGNLDAFYGNLDAFYGNLDAFYGDLDAFWGNLDAFYGNLDAFYGNLDAFWGNLDAFYGSIDAFYGSLDAFWGSLDAFYGDLDTFSGDPIEMQSSLQKIINQSRRSFGSAIRGQTGNGFRREVLNPLLKKYGIDRDLNGVEDLSRGQYAMFLIELNDQLMSFTGVDHVDHWMGDINWTPKLSQDAGGGEGVVVGLLDTPITDASLIGGQVQAANGFGLSQVDHGAGVASILAGAHDGTGVMGVAPNVDFLVFNPFDETFTANWDDVTTGIIELSQWSDASIINMSLGVKGYTLNPEWATVFNDWDALTGTLDTLIVKAAGNTGTTQTEDVDFWFSPAPNNLIIVGSVDPNGVISKFSNRPGDACIISWFRCSEENKLMNRFLVAPGEMILVQDNSGNLGRASGTSIAAPMVSGAAALVQSRWEWLKEHPEATADILLQTATDLGAPGPDPVYGMGLLNVEAALAPIEYDLLYINTDDGRITLGNIGGLSLDLLGILDTDTTLTVFEDLRDTSRDFEVPVAGLNLSSAVTAVDQIVQTTTESYLAVQTQTSSTLNSLGGLLGGSSGGLFGSAQQSSGLTDLPSRQAGAFGNANSAWQGTLTAQARPAGELSGYDAMPVKLSATMVHNDTGASVMAGEGHAGIAFSGSPDFGMTSDHDKHRGGVNPFLGLASGGFFATTSLPVGDRMQLAFGYTSNEDLKGYKDQFSGEIHQSGFGLADYNAEAINAKFSLTVTDRLQIGADVTQVAEQTGLLGGQGAGVFNLEGGSQTNAYTFQATSRLDRGISLSASATTANTDPTQFNGSLLSVDADGIQSSAYQLTGTKRGVLHGLDMVRLSFSQPLYVEDGALAMQSEKVIDRSTGETGLVTDTVRLDQNQRRYVSEVLYTTPLNKGRTSLTAFGLVETNNMDLGVPLTVVTGGAKFNIEF